MFISLHALSTDFQKKTQISNFIKICPVGAELSTWTDGQTDCVKLVVTFCNFVNASKN